jgi:hypothetical protein
MSHKSIPQSEIINNVPGIESVPVPRSGDIALGSSAMRQVVVVERVSNPTGVIGHPSNPLTEQAQAYANYLKREADDE